MDIKIQNVWTIEVEERVKPEAYIKLGGLIASSFDTAGLHRPGDFDISYGDHEDYSDCIEKKPHKHVIATHSGYTKEEHGYLLHYGHEKSL